MAEKERVRKKGSGRFYYRRKEDIQNDLVTAEPGKTTNEPCPDDTQTEKEVQTERNDVKWTDGRRIVELSVLASQLSECQKCKKNPLHLIDCEDEIQHGLGSLLKIKCRSCSHINLVYTGKQHRDPEKTGKGMRIFDINTKVALAMIHCGLGPEQVASFLTVLNIPPITVRALKSREREIGKAVEQKAADTCEAAIQQELIMANEASTEEDEPDEQIQKISVSYDGAWQKRGSGRSYNSRTGHGTFIGEKSGKCTGYGVKSTDCRKCLFSKNTSDHDCRKNFAGSAKSMEAAIATDLTSNIMNLGYRIEYITMDEDSTTINRIKTCVDPEIQKKSDKNHMKKTLPNSLFELKKDQKMLSVSVINYFVKCASFAISQNKENSADLEKTLTAIVPHAFGNHEDCNGSWCGYLRDPDGYKHTDLPGGFDLSDDSLRKELEKTFQKFAEKSDKLVCCGSSQGNESLNQIISTKVPKWKHFGGSESLNFRVAAGVSQKNIGRQYISEVNNIKGLSPGKITTRRNKQLDEKRKRKKEMQKLPEVKLMRKKKKIEIQTKQLCAETKEGPTYESGIAMGPTGDNVDITAIPDPIQLKPINGMEGSDQIAIVTFDLETTGFGNDTEIVQLAASSDNKMFNKYSLPTGLIHPKAAEVTHLYSTGSRLFYKGEPIGTEPLKTVLEGFINWIPHKTLLVAHNCKRFDSIVLVNNLNRTKLLEEFKQKVIGFADTLPLFKRKIPQRQSYSQGSLAADLLKENYDAHNAKDDVVILKKLTDSLQVTVDELLPCSFKTDDVLSILSQSRLKKQNLATFNGVIREKVMTKQMCEKAASSGLTLAHLKCACERQGFDGLFVILKEEIDGKPRVTKQKKIVERLFKYLSK